MPEYQHLMVYLFKVFTMTAGDLFCLITLTCLCLSLPVFMLYALAHRLSIRQSQNCDDVQSEDAEDEENWEQQTPEYEETRRWCTWCGKELCDVCLHCSNPKCSRCNCLGKVH